MTMFTAETASTGDMSSMTTAEIVRLLAETDAPRRADGRDAIRDFLSRALGEIQALLWASPTHRKDAYKPGSPIFDTYVQMKKWLMEGVRIDSFKLNKNVRIINALRAGIRSGSLVLNEEEDLQVFKYIYLLGMKAFPQVVEHFIITGDFIELLRAVLRDSKKPNWTKAARIKMYRLYAFDLAAQDADMSMVPLEIRMSFAGFDNEMSAEEEEREHLREYDLDHIAPKMMRA